MRTLILRTAAVLMLTLMLGGLARPDKIAAFCCGLPPPCNGRPVCPVK